MKILHALVISTLVSAGLTGCEPPADDVIELSYASPYPPSHPFSQADQVWMDAVQRQSTHAVRFKHYWSGSLMTADMSMLELRHGLADIGLITPIYTLGGAHALRVQSGFYGGVQTMEDQLQVYQCLEQRFPAIRDELTGLKVLAVQGGNFPALITRDKPVTSLKDLQGLRLRVQTEAVGVLKALGADPVNMPMGEVYSALAKGVIDGVVAPADTLQSLHFSEVANHYTQLRFSRGAYPARAMSMRRWQELPRELQQTLSQSSAIWQQALMTELDNAERRGIDHARKAGIQFHSIPAEEQAQLDALYNQVALHEAKSVKALGIDAVPMFEYAQALISKGSPIHCEETPQP